MLSIFIMNPLPQQTHTCQVCPLSLLSFNSYPISFSSYWSPESADSLFSKALALYFEFPSSSCHKFPSA